MKMSSYVKITEQEMDSHLKSSKGWVKNVCGYEYVYDYKMKNVPCVMIKVMSSINTGTGEGRNKGSDAIRVFAVKLDKDGKVSGGYIRKQVVYRTTHWKANLLKAYMDVRNQVFQRAGKDGIYLPEK